MTNEPSIFTVVEWGPRTVVAFQHWPSTREAIFSIGLPTFLSRVHAELTRVVTRNQSTVLALDMAPADFVPSSFIGKLLLLHKRGVTIELLEPSPTVRQILEHTRLDTVFLVRE